MDGQALLKSNGKLSFSSFFSWVLDLTWGKKKGWKIIGATIVVLAIAAIIGFIISGVYRLFLRGGSGFLFYIGTGLYYFLDAFFSSALVIGLMNFILGIVREGDAKFNSLFTNIGWNKIWKYIGCSLLFGIIGFVAGLLSALILRGLPVFIVVLGIPLFVVIIRFMFSYYVIVDKGFGPISALKYSWNITKGRFWETIGLIFCLIGVMLIICLVLSLLSRFIVLLILAIIVVYIFMIPILAVALFKYYVIISENYENNVNGNKFGRHRIVGDGIGGMNINLNDANGMSVGLNDIGLNDIGLNDIDLNTIDGIGVDSNNINGNSVNINNTSIDNATGDNIDLKNINVDELTPIGTIERPKHDPISGNL